MKKLALILALLIIPCTAFGLEMLNDNALDEVTGQSGVSIAMDDIQLFLHVDRFAYIDCDGYSTNSNYGGECASTIGAAFVINNFQMDTININMIGTSGSGAAYAEGKDVDGSAGTAYLGLDDATSAFGGVSFEAAYTTTLAAYGIDAKYRGTDHIGNDGTAYSVVVDGYWRNPGHQSWNYDASGTAALGWFAPNWSFGASANAGGFVGSYDDGHYTGALPMASATCGAIPLFYDYGSRDNTTSCALAGTWTTGQGHTLGLNHYTNTNNISTRASFHPQAITIDLTGELPLHTTGLAIAADPGSGETIGGVLIGLPTAEIHIQEMRIGSLGFTADISTNQGSVTKTTESGVSSTRTEAGWVKNNNESFGTIVIEGVTFTTFGGWMEIAPTGYSKTDGL